MGRGVTLPQCKCLADNLSGLRFLNRFGNMLSKSERFTSFLFFYFFNLYLYFSCWNYLIFFSFQIDGDINFVNNNIQYDFMVQISLGYLAKVLDFFKVGLVFYVNYLIILQIRIAKMLLDDDNINQLQNTLLMIVYTRGERSGFMVYIGDERNACGREIMELRECYTTQVNQCYYTLGI